MTTPVVLDEDTYTEALSAIIERDFYPQLSTLSQRHNYSRAQQTDGASDLETTLSPSNKTTKSGMYKHSLYIELFHVN